MSNYVSQDDLDEAIADVREDIRDTENRLREEFTGAVRYEVNRMDRHLDTQDNSIKWIQRYALTSLVLIVCALIALISYIKT